jgi:hypothetical protein
VALEPWGLAPCSLAPWGLVTVHPPALPVAYVCLCTTYLHLSFQCAHCALHICVCTVHQPGHCTAASAPPPHLICVLPFVPMHCTSARIQHICDHTVPNMHAAPVYEMYTSPCTAHLHFPFHCAHCTLHIVPCAFAWVLYIRVRPIHRPHHLIEQAGGEDHGHCHGPLEEPERLAAAQHRCLQQDRDYPSSRAVGAKSVLVAFAVGTPEAWSPGV